MLKWSKSLTFSGGDIAINLLRIHHIDVVLFQWETENFDSSPKTFTYLTLFFLTHFAHRKLRTQLFGKQSARSDEQSRSEYGPRISWAFEPATHNHAVLLDHSFKLCHLARNIKAQAPDLPTYGFIPASRSTLKYQIHISHFYTVTN